MFLAEAIDPSIREIGSYGILGLILVLIMFGWLWPKPAVDKLEKSEAQAQARGDVLAVLVKDDVLPLLREVAKATGPAGPLEKIADRVERIEHRLDVISATGGRSTS